MKFDPEIRHRRSIRLRGYDYTDPGEYFVTLCTQEKEPLFGEILEEEMKLNAPGRMSESWWNQLNRKYQTVRTDEFVVLPNHVHSIIRILGADLRVRPTRGANKENPVAHIGAPLHRVVQWFKTMTTNDYLRGVHDRGWPVLRGKLWQRNYYEHIIRNPRELDIIREYIATNQLRWSTDPENLL